MWHNAYQTSLGSDFESLSITINWMQFAPKKMYRSWLNPTAKKPRNMASSFHPLTYVFLSPILFPRKRHISDIHRWYRYRCAYIKIQIQIHWTWICSRANHRQKHRQKHSKIHPVMDLPVMNIFKMNNRKISKSSVCRSFVSSSPWSKWSILARVLLIIPQET